MIIGNDHAGVATKQYITQYLTKQGVPVEDLGSTDQEAEDDYPDFAKKVAQRVLTTGDQGILICGSGTGMAIAANKIRGIRAAMAYDEYSAAMARRDNDANILVVRSRKFPRTRLKPIIDAWMKTSFSNLPRHKRRLQKIQRMEQ